MSYAKALECAIKKTENNIKEIGLDLREFADATGHFGVDSRPINPQGTYYPEMQTLPMQDLLVLEYLVAI